jgi:M6 family metalloprotease-like protein
MAPNSQLKPALLMTMLMLLSIALAPVSDWSRVIDDERTDEADGFSSATDGRAEVKTTLVIVTQFSGDSSSRWSNTEVEDLIFGSMSDMFTESSYGAIEVDGQVVGPVSLDNTGTSYEYISPGVGTLYRFTDGTGGTGVVNDALEALVAIQPAFDFSQFDYLIVLVNGDWWRGLGGGGGNGYTLDVDYADGSDADVSFDGVSLVGENTKSSGGGTGDGEAEVWGRIAHEFGHQLGLGHVTGGYDHPFDLMGKLMPGHPSTFTKEGQPGFRDEANWMTPSRIKTLSPSVGTHTLQPLEMDAGPFQALKLPLISGTDDIADVYYMVEVRRQILMDDVDWCSNWGADTDGDDAADDDECTIWQNQMPDEGVFIYRVNPNDDDELAGDLPIQLVDANPSTTSMDDALFDVGETFQLNAGGADADGAVHWADTSGKEILIRVESELEGSYRVYVEYEKSELEPPDLFINEWDPAPYASIDIWVDSELNEWDEYKYHVEGDIGTPDVGNGDDPWANHVNRLWARVENTGEFDAEDVTIQYYFNNPMGIGDKGDWQLIGEVETTIPAESTVEEYIDWTPNIPGLDPYTIEYYHSCVKVVVLPHADEVDKSNNEAQENINYFETRSSSPFGAVSGEFEVANPFNYSTEVMLDIVVDTPGWEAGLSWYSVILQPNEVLINILEVTPPIGATVGVPGTVHVTGSYVAGLPDGSVHIVPIGGITTMVSPVEKIDITITLDSTTVTDGTITITGDITGQGLLRYPVYEAPAALLFTGPSGAEYIVHSDLGEFSGPHAAFSETVDVWALEPRAGDWTIQAVYAGDAHHENDVGTPLSFRVLEVEVDAPLVAIEHEIFIISGILDDPIQDDSKIYITYTSPSGAEYRHATVPERGVYTHRFIFDECETWTVDFSYTSQRGNTVKWSEQVYVMMDVGPVGTVSSDNTSVTDPYWTTRGEVRTGETVKVGGNLNSLSGFGDVTATTTGRIVTIRAWSPSGEEYTRTANVDDEMRFEDEFEMDEAGRWMVQYEYTDDDGNVMSWGEAIDVEDTEEKEIFTYESGVILAAALIILTGLLLVAVGKRNRQDD